MISRGKNVTKVLCRPTKDSDEIVKVQFHKSSQPSDHTSYCTLIFHKNIEVIKTTYKPSCKNKECTRISRIVLL